MAESIIIHFSELNLSKLPERLNKNFDQSGENQWHHPREDYLVMIAPYDDYESEYEEAEKKTVREKLKGPPSASYDFEIRRSRSDEACDLLEVFIRNELSEFDFVVDDMDHIYSKNDLLGITDFLDVYRYNKK